MTLLLVRHAHAGERRAWDGDDELRPLSDKGHRQADGLADSLRKLSPDRILTSPAVRCRQTVEPLGRAMGIDVADDGRLFEGTSTDDVRAMLDELDGTATVWCSHGDIIPKVLRELIERGMDNEDDLRWQKASTWVVDHDPESGWGTARYLAPPRKP